MDVISYIIFTLPKYPFPFFLLHLPAFYLSFGPQLMSIFFRSFYHHARLHWMFSSLNNEFFQVFPCVSCIFPPLEQKVWRASTSVKHLLVNPRDAIQTKNILLSLFQRIHYLLCSVIWCWAKICITNSMGLIVPLQNTYIVVKNSSASEWDTSFKKVIAIKWYPLFHL
jgi:hypothetical protein